MAKVKHFNGEIELTHIHGMLKSEFANAFPGVVGKRYDSFHMLVGSPPGETPVFVQGVGWKRTILPVERIVTYKSNPSKHQCDARCLHAKGRTMNCECACGGKNHGRGSLSSYDIGDAA